MVTLQRQAQKISKIPSISGTGLGCFLSQPGASRKKAYMEHRVLTRSKHGLVSGTLRGMANYYHLNLNGLQLVFLIAALFGFGLVIYLVLWMSIPAYSKRQTLLQAAQASYQKAVGSYSQH